MRACQIQNLTWLSERSNKMPKRKVSLRQRIENSYIPVTECGCWIWLKGNYANGYGGIGINKKTILAHRASWMVFRGEIPQGMMVLHHCDNRLCINPDHLFLGTHIDNMNDRDKKGRNKPRPGILNPKAKLTVKDIVAIRNSKLGPVEIARNYGMDRGTIWRIRTRKYWSHIP